MTNTQLSAKSKPNTSLLIRGALWIAISALIAAALVCVVWVLIGDQQGLIGRAFLTIVLLAGFAGIAILEAGLAPNRADWVSLLSMISWIIALLVGAVKIWLPDDSADFGAVERFFQLLLVVGVLQLALLHVRLFQRAAARHVTTLTRVIVYATFVFLGLLVALLVFFLTFPHTFEYRDLYWRIVVALTILAAVGTMLIPLLNALFAPKPHIAAAVSAGYPAAAPVAAPAAPAAALPWPTYADARTPLPMLPDGNPDWNAYYTGVPTPGATTFPAPEPVAQAAPFAPQPIEQAVPAQPIAAEHVLPQPVEPQPVEPTVPAVPDADAAVPVALAAPVTPVTPASAPQAFPPAPPVPPTQ
ncbi:hypothetical protein [Microbacterium panaciterrae]|uniref:Agglutinin receptor n=1 Tax=Microbacterium panaciterrae TaxID=985759 RepID=A0ABP8NZQ8_9MICO